MKMDKKTLKEIISEEIRLGLKPGAYTWGICPTKVADKIIPQIKQYIKDQVPRTHKSPDNYASLEKWADCEHLKQDMLADNCIHCDMKWSISRMRFLEKQIFRLEKIIEDLK